MKKKELRAEITRLQEQQARQRSSDKKETEEVDREVRLEFLGLTLLSYQKSVRNDQREHNNG